MCINSACKNIRNPSIRSGRGSGARAGDALPGQGGGRRPADCSPPRTRPARPPSAVRCPRCPAAGRAPHPGAARGPSRRQRRGVPASRSSRAPRSRGSRRPRASPTPTPRRAESLGPRAAPGYSRAVGASEGGSPSRLMSPSSMARPGRPGPGQEATRSPPEARVQGRTSPPEARGGSAGQGPSPAREGTGPLRLPRRGTRSRARRSPTRPPWRSAAPLLLPLGLLGRGPAGLPARPRGYLPAPPSPRPARSAAPPRPPDAQPARGTLEPRGSPPASGPLISRGGRWGPERRRPQPGPRKGVLTWGGVAPAPAPESARQGRARGRASSSVQSMRALPPAADPDSL